MQETKTRAPADESPTPRPSWIRVVALLAAVALIGGVLFATWQVVGGDNADSNDNGGGAAEPDFSLTDDQAIARFEQLNERRIRAYETTDLTLVNRFAGPGPFRDEVLNELRSLRRDGVTAKPTFETEYLNVTSNLPTRITFEQAVVFDLRFFNEDGEDVTTQGKPERLVIDWTLQYFDEGWLLTRSVATEAGPADG